MTLRAPFRRGQTPPPARKDLDAFLVSIERHERLCNIDLGKYADTNGKEQVAKDRQLWLTPVLGSGCATSSERSAKLWATAASVEKTLAKPPRHVDGEELSRVVRCFTEALIEDRLHVTPEIPPPDHDPLGEEHEWLADVLVVAALLTKVYSKAKALSNDALPRPTTKTSRNCRGTRHRGGLSRRSASHLASRP